MTEQPELQTKARAGIGARGGGDGDGGNGDGRNEAGGNGAGGRRGDGRGRGGGRGGTGGRRGAGRGGGRDGDKMVPDATFVSYYGRPVVKASPWEADIPVYLFLGGLAAGSSLLSAGADLTGRPSLRRTGRVGALVGISVSFAALVHDLGRPARFVNMLRVAKWTSPMSVGTWILSAYGPLAMLAGAAEVAPSVRLLPDPVVRLASVLGRPAGLAAALLAPAVASYTAVLLSDTATPSWHEAHRELPFVFVGSASAAAAGLGLLGAATADAGPARKLAVGGAVVELAMGRVMERSMGMTAETLHIGTPGRLRRASELLTAGGAALAVLGRRSRVLSAVSGAALLAGSACTRFAVFHAGQNSAKDPKYTIVPQRERVDSGGMEKFPAQG